MSIKVSIPANQNTITVGGLYQWDYGQVLEIECVELGSEIMEVHFACHGMTEAIVRPCTFANGVGTVTIPDRCLEQASNITAWVYKINGTQGHTVKTITLPVVARTRPSKTQDVPNEYINKYAEALTEINEAVNAIENGNVTAAEAKHTLEADHAKTATSAVSATQATKAVRADIATTASGFLLSDAPIILTNSTIPSQLIKEVTITKGEAYFNENVFSDEGIYLVLASLPDKRTYGGLGYVGTKKGTDPLMPIPYGFYVGKEYLYIGLANNLTEFQYGDLETSATLKIYKVIEFPTK